MARRCRSLRRCEVEVRHETRNAKGRDPVNAEVSDYWMPAFAGMTRGKGKAPQMPIKYDELMALKNLGQKYAYTDREVMRYACGIGMGANRMEEKELAFVNEAIATPRALRRVPT